MNQEEVFRSQQLAEERAGPRKTEVKKTKPKKGGALKALLKSPIVKLLFPTLGEVGSGGILPCQTAYIIYTYHEEKKSGNPGNPNLAEYLMIGGLAAIVDVVGLLGLTGFLLILSLGVTIPCLILIWFWRLNKHGKKSATPTKKLKTKKT